MNPTTPQYTNIFEAVTETHDDAAFDEAAYKRQEKPFLPTRFAAGSIGKKLVIAARIEAGVPLFHPRDPWDSKGVQAGPSNPAGIPGVVDSEDIQKIAWPEVEIELKRLGLPTERRNWSEVLEPEEEDECSEMASDTLSEMLDDPEGCTPPERLLVEQRQSPHQEQGAFSALTGGNSTGANATSFYDDALERLGLQDRDGSLESNETHSDESAIKIRRHHGFHLAAKLHEESGLREKIVREAQEALDARLRRQRGQSDQTDPARHPEKVYHPSPLTVSETQKRLVVHTAKQQTQQAEQDAAAHDLCADLWMQATLRTNGTEEIAALKAGHVGIQPLNPAASSVAPTASPNARAAHGPAALEAPDQESTARAERVRRLLQEAYERSA
jgi:hypothetical protein